MDSWRFGVRLPDVVYIFIDADEQDRTKPQHCFVKGFLFSFLVLSLSMVSDFSYCSTTCLYFFSFLSSIPGWVVYVNCCAQFLHVNTPHCIYPLPADRHLGYANFAPSQTMLQ